MAPKKKASKKKGPGKKAGKKGGKGAKEKKPAKVLAYHDEEYWNNRYIKQPEPFDWYQSFKELKPLLNLYLPKDQIVFNAGCGNGLLGEDLVKDGYLNVISVDNSASCFEQLNARYKGNKDFPGFNWFRQDIKELKMFKDTTIDNVIDKGFLDSILCAADAQTNVGIVLGEICSYEDFLIIEMWDVAGKFIGILFRIMKVGCKYINITYGDPRIRMPWLKTAATLWSSILVHVLPRPGSSKALKPSPRDVLEPVYMLDDHTLGPQFNLDDPDWHYIYVCTKETEDMAPKPPLKKK